MTNLSSRLSLGAGLITVLILIITFIFGLGFNWAKVTAIEVKGADHESRLRITEERVGQLMAKLNSLDEKIGFLYDQKLKELNKEGGK